MPTSQADFDKLVQAAKELLASGTMVSFGRWASKAGVAEAAVRDLFDDPRRSALERAAGGRLVRAEGGLFLVK